MRTVIVNILTQADQVQTANPSGGLVINLINAAGERFGQPATVASAPYTATFSDVPAGTYTATAQNVDNTGAAIGSPVTSAPYSVVDLPVTQAYDVPVSITISASA